MTEKNKQALIVGLVLAGLLLFLVGYFYFMSVAPTIRDNTKLREQLDTRIANQQSELRRINEFINNTEERERLAAIVASAKKRLPSDSQGIEFLQLLRESLTKTGATLTRVAPEKSVRRSLYEEIPYSVRGSARYHEFGQFINLIECNPERFMRVNGFTLTNDPKRPSIHPMDVGVSTFIFRSR